MSLYPLCVIVVSKVQEALFFVIVHILAKNPRLTSGDGFELQVSPSCAALSPGEACLIGCRWPFVGQVVIAQCPVGNTDRFQAGLSEFGTTGFQCEGLTGLFEFAGDSVLLKTLWVIDGYGQTR